ncbi:antirestriction protein ArdA [Breoghania corrubedonensis]|uniref:Antirestriction protein ArdA n=1 Tax=Breoghania corrubedonensis TaxID=665038 RepID=A0A2T5VD42_9HYPH|nr:antirestriction protein ArdA [Breoghania corrubedonensis]PTW61689.1 antirestriction protein ArdA [Breoghania corrubedonensis]
MSTILQGNGAKSMYFAQPYNLSAVGFYFTDLEDYQAKVKGLTDEFGYPVEEFELQYIDGDHARLFEALRISQASLADWFDLLDELDDDEDRYLIACHLAGEGYAIGELAERWDDYRLYRGTAADYAAEIVAECYEIPGNLEAYIDYERLGRDMVLGGDITEIEYGLILLGG